MDVIVFTSDKHLWACRPLAWLFNKYWSSDQRVIIVGYNLPDFGLPGNFLFYSISETEYPADRWVDGALDFFDQYVAEKFIFFHEDYWITRKVDIEGIANMEEYMNLYPNIFRIDLTADRLYAGGMRDVDYYKRFDIIEAAGSQYQMSHQACIINTEMYIKLLRHLDNEHKSAWGVELEGTTFVNNHGPKMRVVGTRQPMVRYANALLKGKLDWNELPKLTTLDYNAIQSWIPERHKGINNENS